MCKAYRFILLSVTFLFCSSFARANTNALVFAPIVVDISEKSEMSTEEFNKALTDALNLDKEVSPEEMIKAIGSLVQTSSSYFKEKDETTNAMGWAGLAAVLLKVLLSLLKLTSGFWKKSKGKWVLRFICLFVGVAFGVISYMAMGYSWYNAIITVISGPGAILITELQKLIPLFNKSKKEAE